MSAKTAASFEGMHAETWTCRLLAAGNNTATAIAIGGRDGNNTHGGNNTSCNSALPRGNGGIATGDNGGNGGNGGDAVEGEPLHCTLLYNLIRSATKHCRLQ